MRGRTRETVKSKDLDWETLEIIQPEKGFRFGTDAFLLADFVKIKNQKESILELGTGCGIIPLLLHFKGFKNPVTAIEIQKELCDCARNNARKHQLVDKISVLNMDLTTYKLGPKQKSFDIVISNPPYYPLKSGKRNVRPAKETARHEVHATMKTIVSAASRCVKPGGRTYFIYPSQRLAELICELRENRLEAKTIQLATDSTKDSTQPEFCLVEATKKGNPGVTVQCLQY